ncbi:hypothetical protein EAF04_004091 [Stromatinia cepivora]|nr:hypothetical protein EAF04_004091 [Stromatinia cepivora]
MPCNTCFDLVIMGHEVHGRHWNIYFAPNQVHEYHLRFTSSDIDTTSSSGCLYCYIIQRGLNLMDRNKSLIDLSRPFTGSFIPREDCPLELELDQQPLGIVRFQFYARRGMKLPQLSAFGIAHDVAPQISVIDCVSTIHSWISLCKEKHESCLAARDDPAFFPIRLIDVGFTFASHVTLINMNEAPDVLDTGTHYATLSHCWGKVDVIKTLKSNVTQNKSGIHLRELPKAFQDAIMIVRALEIKYLWIDTLCIIQDDEDGWNSESICMAGIYSNSYVNLAATAAADSRSGCLIPRTVNISFNKALDTESILVYESIYGSGARIFIRPSFESVHHRYSTRNALIEGLPDDQIAPLLTRAWVFQERQLALRTIHFHSSEMIMECKSGLWCECTGLERRYERSAKNFSTSSKIIDQKKLLMLWYEVVKEYSQLRLTKDTDRPIALLGVAKAYHDQLKSGYLAGLWAFDIARGMLWSAARLRYRKKRTTNYRPLPSFAATWSWQSLLLDYSDRVNAIIFPTIIGRTFREHEHFLFLGSEIERAALNALKVSGICAIHVKGMVKSARLLYDCFKGLDRETTIEFNKKETKHTICIGFDPDVSQKTLRNLINHNGIVYYLLIGTMNKSKSINETPISFLYILIYKKVAINTYKQIDIINTKSNANTL